MGMMLSVTRHFPDFSSRPRNKPCTSLHTHMC